MDHSTLLKAATDKDFGTFEEGFKALLYKKSMELIGERADEVLQSISEDREPVDMSAVPPSLFLPHLKEHVVDAPVVEETA